jgi:hypothetical protein
MGRQTKRGVCAVCREYGDLSFEHIPPRSCYNDRSLKLLEGTKAINLAPGELRPGRIQQRGAGGYYTCGRCNNRTGNLYVPETIQWVERGAEILRLIGDREGQDARSYTRFVGVAFVGVRPLLFLKQVVYMFLCINGPGFTAVHPDLRAFVLDRDNTEMSGVCHFHLGLTWGPGARSVGGSAVSTTARRGPAYVSDISFPPFTYTMWLGERQEMFTPCEITHYGSYGPSEVCDVHLALQVGFTHVAYPSDHRSRAAIEQQAGSSRKLSR